MNGENVDPHRPEADELKELLKEAASLITDQHEADGSPLFPLERKAVLEVDAALKRLSDRMKAEYEEVNQMTIEIEYKEPDSDKVVRALCFDVRQVMFEEGKNTIKIKCSIPIYELAFVDADRAFRAYEALITDLRYGKPIHRMECAVLHQIWG